MHRYHGSGFFKCSSNSSHGQITIHAGVGDENIATTAIGKYQSFGTGSWIRPLFVDFVRKLLGALGASALELDLHMQFAASGDLEAGFGRFLRHC